MNFEKWYKAKQTSYTDKLADTIWCNDKSTVKDVIVNLFESENGVLNKVPMVFNGLGYKQELTVYGATVRNYTSELGNNNYTYGTGLSLICPKDNDGGKLSKFTVEDTVNGNGNLDYKIGLLTLDEMVLAGLVPYQVFLNNNYDENSVTSYLRGNATSGYYWTISPAIFKDNAAAVWFSFKDGALITDVGDDTLFNALRPAIALKSDTTISGGNGTASSPFVIN